MKEPRSSLRLTRQVALLLAGILWACVASSPSVAAEKNEDLWERLQRALAENEAEAETEATGENVAASFARWQKFEEQWSVAARQSRNAEEKAQAELGRFLAISRLAAALPSDPAERSPAMESWIAAHGQEVYYNEIGGNFLVAADPIWALQERAATTAFAEEIAYLAATTPLGGECEGYLPCQIEATLRTSARYLALYPQGAHVAELATEIYFLSEPLDEIGELDPEGRVEALAGLAKLRKILEQARFPEQKAYLGRLTALQKQLGG